MNSDCPLYHNTYGNTKITAFLESYGYVEQRLYILTPVSITIYDIKRRTFITAI